MTLFTAGEPITADALNRATQRIVSRGARVTSVASTSNTGIMRIDSAQLWGGFLYKVGVNSVPLDVSTNAETPRLNIYYTIDGSTPTTASSQLAMAQADVPDAAVGDSHGVWNFYTPVGDISFSALLTISRAVGAGTVTALAGSGTPGPIEFYIENMGTDPGDTATEI